MSPGPPSPTPLAPERDGLFLDNGSRVAVIGGGPAGSFFTYFLFEMAERIGMELAVDIYEPRDFSNAGPQGCNMCGGSSPNRSSSCSPPRGSTSLPPSCSGGSTRTSFTWTWGPCGIEPTRRRNGSPPSTAAGARAESPNPAGTASTPTSSNWRRCGCTGSSRACGRDRSKRRETAGHHGQGNLDRLRSSRRRGGREHRRSQAVRRDGRGLSGSRTTKTYISELFLGERTIKTYFGNAMHMFLLDLPRLEFAALIPKGEYVTMVMLGAGIDKTLVEAFFSTPEVRKCFPSDWSPPADFCRCAPAINISGAVKPFADRMVLVGDSGVSRLYKDGIGGAYRTAKAAARTAVFEGWRRRFPEGLSSRLPVAGDGQPDRKGGLRDHGYDPEIDRAPEGSVADDHGGTGITPLAGADERRPVGHLHGERAVRGRLPTIAPPRFSRTPSL